MERNRKARRPPRRYAVLIGDVRGSRRHPDRRGLQRRILAALAATNRRVPAAQALAVTLGDEFQGAYTTRARALRAAVLLWLSLRDTAELRFGMGWGEIPVRDHRRGPFGQDGPAWWAARDALDRIRREEGGRYRPAGWALAYAEHDDPERQGWTNAAALLLGATLARMRAPDRALSLGLLQGKKLQELAAEQGVTAGSASVRATRNGPYALLRALQELDDVP